MRIVISGKDYKVEEALKARIEKKVGKMQCYFAEEAEAQVRLSLERGARNIAEITLICAGTVIRGEAVTDDMYLSVDTALEKLEKQIHRNRTRLERRMRKGTFQKAAPEFIAEPTEEEVSGKLVRTKRFVMKPMTVEDAIDQMELLGHSFFLFINEASGATCVVYRRQDGDYGLLEPDNA